jgi:hypothetical protein
MNIQVLDARSDARGGYKVDVSRGEQIGRVSSEWFSRPADERYLSLSELAHSVRDRADREVAWSEVDELAVGRAVVIPLGARTRLLLRGPLVQRYAVSTLSGAADLGLVAVRPLSDIP